MKRHDNDELKWIWKVAYGYSPAFLAGTEENHENSLSGEAVCG
jgi:hypothetical protein